MFELQVPTDILFYMLYAATAVMYALACIYLFFRRGNAFSVRIQTPVRLRRWAAAGFGFAALSHLWYLPAPFLTSPDAVMRCFLIAGLLDFMTMVPIDAAVLLCMLQDRRRPLWAPFAAVTPLAVIMVVSIAQNSYALRPLWLGYLLLVGICFMLYMIRATRQYGRWLRDNYADLEHKEVWHSLVVLGLFLLIYVTYTSGVGGAAHLYIIHFIDVPLIAYLLWRVETLSDLSIVKPVPAQFTGGGMAAAASPAPGAASPEAEPTADGPASDEPATEDLPKASDEYISALLQQRCVDTEFYLHNDLTLVQLSKLIGVNRYYLSQYFSRHGTTYNAYVNELRIKHFVNLYRNAVAHDDDYTIKRLAEASGYQSYSTFSLAFKQLMGQNVSSWQRDEAEKDN